MDTRDLLEQLAKADWGVVSRRAAIKAGASSAEIERLRHLGELKVVRRGWYHLPGAKPTVVAAVKDGAAITCVSALKLHGLWVPTITKTHLRRDRHRKKPAHEDCRAYGPLPAPIRAVDPLPLALQCAANCLKAEEFVATLDSTLRMAIYTEEDLREIFEQAPPRITRLLDFLDPLSGSGTESLTRYRLRCAHIRVRSQQTIPTLGRVDLLVGDKLIIECDSKGHHNNDQRLVDNQRDRVATRGDYRVMRFDYTEVMGDWESIYAEILDIVRTDRHIGKVRVVEPADSDATKPDLAS